MDSIYKKNKLKDLAKSGWIDDLSEEEEEVLKHGAEIDKYIKSGHADKKIRIGIIDDLDIKD